MVKKVEITTNLDSLLIITRNIRPNSKTAKQCIEDIIKIEHLQVVIRKNS